MDKRKQRLGITIRLYTYTYILDPVVENRHINHMTKLQTRQDHLKSYQTCRIHNFPEKAKMYSYQIIENTFQYFPC